MREAKQLAFGPIYDGGAGPLLVVYLSPADNSPHLNWSVLVLCQAQKQPPCYTLLLGVFDGFIRILEVHASRRLTRIFLRNDQGRRLVYGGTCTLQEAPHWRDYLLFYEASGLLQTSTADLAGLSLGAPRSSVALRPGWSPALVVGPVLIMGPYTLTRARLNCFACWRKRHGPGSGPPEGRSTRLPSSCQRRFE